MSVKLLKKLENRQDVAQNHTPLPLQLAGVRFARRVRPAAAAIIIPAVRITQLFRTPSLDGRRAVQTVPLPVSLCFWRNSPNIARRTACSGRGKRFDLSLLAGMSWVNKLEHIGKKGKIRCQPSNGSQQSLCVAALQPAATQSANRPLSGQVPGLARQSFLTPTQSQLRLWLRGATCFIVRKTPASADRLSARATSQRPNFIAIFIHDIFAVRFATRGVFACAIQPNKRDRTCSARS
jgi:hypothetical protein